MFKKLSRDMAETKIQIKLLVKKTKMSEVKKYTEIKLMADLTLPNK